LYTSDLPPFVTDLVNAQLPRFFTIAHLSRDGDFGINDDLHMRRWGAHGSHNPDVSVYASTMILSLFPDFHRQMVEDQYHHYIGRLRNKDIPGKVDRNTNHITTSLRHYQWTGDEELLDKVYPQICELVPAVVETQDTNGDGVPELHGGNSTYDNLVQWNVSAWLTGNWVAALEQLRMMAEHRDDAATVAMCEDLIARSRAVVDQHLWNGQYYEFYSDYDGTWSSRTRRDKKTGERVPERRKLDDHLCFADQLLGSLWMELVGGGPVFDVDKERVALQTIVDTNLYPGIGLINLRDPRRADRTMAINAYNWIDQPNTLFTGVEFATAASLLYAGMYDQSMQVLEPLDARHRKNGFYWNHQEAFNHYLRSMAGWMVLDGALGLSIDRGTYTFSPKLPGKECTLFMSLPGCYGTFHATESGVAFVIMNGTWSPHCLVLDAARVAAKAPTIRLDDRELSADVSREGTELLIRFSEPPSIGTGNVLAIR
jgi:hypothetical protein